MKISRLKATQKILRINWVVVPALGMWIWVTSGLFNAVLFVIIWLVADKIWDWLTRLLTAGAGRIGATEYEEFQMQISGEVPGRKAFMMIFGLLGTFILPWVVAGLLIDPVAAIVEGPLAGLWGTAAAGRQPWGRYVLLAENFFDSLLSNVVGVTALFSREVWGTILLAGGFVSVVCVIYFYKRRTRFGARRRSRQFERTSPNFVGPEDGASPAMVQMRGQDVATLQEKPWDEISPANEKYPAYLYKQCPNCAGKIYLEDMKCPRCHQTFNAEKVAVLIDLVLNLHKGELDPIIDFKSATKRCPACIESIKLEALICRYCRRAFTPAEVGIEKMKALRERVKDVETDDKGKVAAAEELSPAEQRERVRQLQLKIEHKIQEEKKREEQHMEDPHSGL
jgi:hypothetical protein